MGDRNVSSDRNISAANAIVDGTIYDSLCKLDVMLPNGQMVPATLVRNANGRVIPLVEVNSQTLPHHQPRPPGQHHPLQGSPTAQPHHLPQQPRSFAKNRILMSSTSNNATSNSPRSSSNNNRHFV